MPLHQPGGAGAPQGGAGLKATPRNGPAVLGTRAALRLASLLLALLLLPWPARALDPDRPAGRFAQTRWNVEQGLPNGTVTAVRQTRDGYLWLGTREGLVRFDGVRFSVFDKHTTAGFSGVTNFVYSLAEDREGGLWIGCRGGGLLRYAKGSFSASPAESGLSGHDVSALLVDRDGTLWVGSLGGGLRRREGDGRFRLLGTKDGPRVDRVSAIAQDRAGTVWVGTSPDRGLYVVRGDQLVRWTPPDGALDGRVTSLLAARDGSLWIGMNDSRLCRLKDGALSRWSLPGKNATDVPALLEDRQGSVWAGTFGNGVVRLRGDPIVVDSTALPDVVVLALAEDREGSLWIGAYAGLTRMKDTPFSSLTAADGLPEGIVKSISGASGGGAWIGMYGGGLVHLEEGRARTWTTRNGLSSNLIRATLEEPDGTVWVGSAGGLCQMRDGVVRRVLTAPDGLSNNEVNAIVRDREGSLWVSTNSGLDRLGDGGTRAFFKADGLPDDHVGALLVDRDGALWIGTYKSGLCRYAAGTFTTFSTARGFPNDNISSLYQDPDGDLWVGTFSGGIVHVRDGRSTAITSSQGLPDDVVFQVLEDGAGTFWMSSSKGIFSVPKSDLLGVARGSLRKVRGSWYGTVDGMPTRECTGGSQPSGWKAPDGTLWFATTRGVALLDPSKLHRNPLPPNVVVEEVVVDDEALDLEARIELPPGRRSFQFRYTALSFLAPEKVRFRYRLAGWDDAWVDAGSRRTAYYTNIPHGRYTFQVVACNNDGVWSPAGASLPFRLRPRFTKTWWFPVLVAATVLAAGFGAHRGRVWRLQVRQEELQRLVDQKTSSLVDANARLEDANASLARSNALLEEAQARIAGLMGSSPQAVQDVTRWATDTAAQVARAVEVDSIGVWVLEDGVLTSLSGTDLAAPALARLRQGVDSPGRPLQSGREVLVPISGASGTLLGTLAISAKAAPWARSEERLVGAFANQLASTLELRSMQRELAVASEKRRVTREQLVDQGVELLHLCSRCSECFPHTVERCPRDGAALESPPGFLPYRLSGRYRLKGLLADGGMGTVFTAVDERLGREVAVKVIKLGRFSDADTKLRFEHEAHAVAQIDHPGVIVVHDLGEVDGGATFLVMELLAGTDLLALVEEQGPGTPSQVALLLQQAASALGAAHRRNIVHRDVKPENIVLVPKDGSFQAKVLDFGLAKTPEHHDVTRTGMLVGTPRYMSPEQAQSGFVDRRSDLYSLAAVTFYALTGEHIVRGRMVVEMLVDVISGSPPLASALVPGLSKEVDALLQAALAKDAWSRPGDIEEWASRLAGELEASPAGGPGWDVSRLGLQPGRFRPTGDHDPTATAVSPVASLEDLGKPAPRPSPAVRPGEPGEP